MIKAIIPLLIISFTFSFCNTDSKSKLNHKRIQVDGGLISGLESSDKEVYIFKGIPFAAPPIGDLRWRPPTPVDPWEGVKECNTFGASGVQPSPEPFYMWSEEFLIPKEPINEDCLYLNIWTPAKRTDENRPVMVWIHGGGFTSGSGSVPIYDGEAMARKGVVFVNINYRLGIFGFFAHPELTAESAYDASGNYGLMDQIAALKWVKNNIAQFGGDPENITIAGQSAGAASVAYLIASPLTKNLFSKAIAESGAGLFSMVPSLERPGLHNLEMAEQEGMRITTELDAKSITTLRTIPAADLLQKVRYRAHPIIDGHVLPERVAKIYRENKQNKVSLLTGWNEDDGILIRGTQDAKAFKEGILSQWGKLSEELLIFYPATNDSIAKISQHKLQRDLAFGSQNYTLANILSDQGRDVFVYRFTRDVPDGDQEDFGAFHTGEVPYALNNLNFVDRPFEPIDYKLSDAMASYWVNFIKSGDPNDDEHSQWPKYYVKSREIMVFGDQTQKGIMKDTLSLSFLSENLLVK